MGGRSAAAAMASGRDTVYFIRKNTFPVHKTCRKKMFPFYKTIARVKMV